MSRRPAGWRAPRHGGTRATTRNLSHVGGHVHAFPLPRARGVVRRAHRSDRRLRRQGAAVRHQDRHSPHPRRAVRGRRQSAVRARPGAGVPDRGDPARADRHHAGRGAVQRAAGRFGRGGRHHRGLRHARQGRRAGGLGTTRLPPGRHEKAVPVQADRGERRRHRRAGRGRDGRPAGARPAGRGLRRHAGRGDGQGRVGGRGKDRAEAAGTDADGEPRRGRVQARRARGRAGRIPVQGERGPGGEDHRRGHSGSRRGDRATEPAPDPQPGQRRHPEHRQAAGRVRQGRREDHGDRGSSNRRCPARRGCRTPATGRR